MSRTVTLVDEDVEWIDEFEDEHDELKNAVGDDGAFREWLVARDLHDAMEIVHRFHRVIANQLIVAGVTDRRHSVWAVRCIHLNRLVKRRRNQVRVQFRELFGEDALSWWLDAFATRHPRAVPPVGP